MFSLEMLGKAPGFPFAFSQRIPSNAVESLATAFKAIKATALIVPDDRLEKPQIKKGNSQLIPIIKKIARQ